MIDGSYSKHKDCTPERTVGLIRSILEGIGIQTEVVSENHPFCGTYSNRIQIAGTTLGSNGKGTTEAFALASGYAELVERIQNGMLAQRCYDTQLYRKHGFYHFADERLLDVEEVFGASGGVVDAWLEHIGLTSRGEKLEHLRFLSEGVYERDDGRLPVVAYADVSDGGIAWLPNILQRTICGSNGLSAGNTMEEALVQALCEVLERHVQRLIVCGQLTPPEIPSEHLDLPGLRETITDIEREGRYRVTMLDCSLGRGYPVVASFIKDKTCGTFGVRFGCHPSFAIAVERTLTEAYQGRTAEKLGSCNDVAPYEEVISVENQLIMTMVGGGVYPPSMFVGQPDWEFAPWPDTDGLGNAELLAYMMDLLHSEGARLFVRDNSHLGFPAYSVVVPGMSEMNCRLSVQQRRIMRVAHVLGSFPRLSSESEELLLERTSLVGNKDMMTATDLFARPILGGALHPARVIGFLQLKHGEYGEACKQFERMSKMVSRPIVKTYWEVMANYARWRGWGLGRLDALALAERLHPKNIARKVAEDTEPEGIMQRNFPSLNCRDGFGCDECQTGGDGMCQGKVELELFYRMWEGMAKSEVSQEALCQALRPYANRNASVAMQTA